jgi:hypothetical protein
MFRSTNIIRELVLNLAKFIFMLKHSVKLRRYMLFGDVAACHRAACMLCPVHTTHTELHIPDVALIQLILLMMSTRLLEICRELKQTYRKRKCASSWSFTRIATIA